jgi:RNA recognition motif-containing protein
VIVTEATDVIAKGRETTRGPIRQNKPAGEASLARIPKPSPGDFPIERATIFVGNLPEEFDRAAFEEIVKRFGTVSSIKLPIDIYTGKLRGFAFIQYSSTPEAQAALNGIGGITLGSRKLRTAPAKARS